MTSNIRNMLVYAAINKAYTLTDYNIQNNLEKQYEFAEKTINSDETLTKDEKDEAINILKKNFDGFKILENEGRKRTCENCQKECLAILYCENCIRNYLEKKFSDWTSENNEVDNLIQKCQMDTISPDKIVEWIPHDKLRNISYLTKGGSSVIYTADWVDGRYELWDSKENQLKRIGEHEVILKKLENVESANRSWFEESKSHLTINNKYGSIVQCYGLTKDPLDGNFLLVMNRMNMSLRDYLQQNHSKINWKKRIKIVDDIVFALSYIHEGNAIHRDLHSGNILFDQISQIFYISDLGFCGPVDKPVNSIYGNLPYIAPEVISGKETTFASDIYSIGILMWEISSGKPPFTNYDHDYYLAMNIINGMRPRIVQGTPVEYKELMQQCWDADSTKRPDIFQLDNRIFEINKSYQNIDEDEEQERLVVDSDNMNTNSNSINSLVRSFSKLHFFEELPEPRNATEEEQEAYHSIQHDLHIPDNITLDYQAEQSDSKMITGKIEDITLDSKMITDNKKSKKTKLNNDKEVRVKNEVEFHYTRKKSIANDDIGNDDIHNSPNLHSEEQDKLEILDD